MSETQRRRIFSTAAFVIATALFVLLRTDVHTYDALSYVLDVDRKPWQELFHPHHLAYGPLGAAIRAAAGALGRQGTSEPLLQAANGIAGGLTAALLTSLLLRLTRRTLPALIGVALLCCSFAFWYYSGEVEVYTIAGLGLVLALYIMVMIGDRPTPRLMLALAAAQSFAVLFHQTNVLLSGAVALLLWSVVQRASPAERLPLLLRLGLPYLGLCIVVVGGAYLWVAVAVSGLHDLAAVSAWLFSYARTGFWGGVPGPATLPALLTGWSRTFAPFGGWLVLLVLLALLPAARQGLRRLPGATRAALAGWVLLYTLFFAWWEADNIEFWIALLPLTALGVALALDELAAQPRLRLLPGAVGLLVVVLGLSNAVALHQRGDSSRDLQRSITAELQRLTTPGDLLIVPDGVLELYLPHYAARDTVYSLSRAMNDAGGDWPAACELLRGRVSEVQRAGFAVMLADDALRPPPAPPGEPPTPAERYGLAAETVAACYAPLLPMAQALQLQAGSTQYLRIAPAPELALGAGWDFTRGTWGWRAERVEPSATPAEGWRMTAGADPALLSPPLQLNTADFSAVEITLATATASRDLQLFLLDTAGQAAEARSLRAVLQPGLEVQTLRLQLADAAELPAVIGGLRLDPVALGDGSDLTLYAIRLISRP